MSPPSSSRPGAPDGNTWSEQDQVLFDDILAFVKANLCIDTTRVFATGFSFGGMMTYSLSTNHQKDIRAAVGIAPANYNIYVPNKPQPIAWMQTTGMSDGTCPWINGTSTTQGAKFIAIEQAPTTDAPYQRRYRPGNAAPISATTSQDAERISRQACTFNGDHTNIANDSGNTNWIAAESWKFFTQF